MRMRILLHMDVKIEVSLIEKRVKTAGFPVAELLRRADVDASQWVRWKQGAQVPLTSTWSKITKAADELVPAARSPEIAT